MPVFIFKAIPGREAEDGRKKQLFFQNPDFIFPENGVSYKAR